MRSHRDWAAVGFAAAFSEVADEFFARFELRARRLVAIEIAYQTNAERNVVQIIAVDVTAVDLAPPPIAHFDLAVAGRCAVADYKMISKPVLHPSDMPMIIIKSAGVPLPSAAVVHHNELPATPFHRCAPDGFDHRSRKITIAGWTTPWPETESPRRRRWRRLEALVFLDTGLFDQNLGALLRRNHPRNFWRWARRRSRHSYRARWRRRRFFRRRRALFFCTRRWRFSWLWCFFFCPRELGCFPGFVCGFFFARFL